ncbi:hypothetical protein K8I61_04685 [bacterium]|nr:hypothetical protein [bacterium]
MDLTRAVPKLNTSIDFHKLVVSLDEREVQMIAHVNGISSLGDLANGLHVPVSVVLDVFARLLEHELVYFDDPDAPAQLRGEIVSARRHRRRRPADEETPAIDEPVVSFESVAPAVAREPIEISAPDRQGAWNLETVFRLIANTAAEHTTGLLRIRGGDGYRDLVYLDGRLLNVVAHPFDPGETFGRVMQRAGLIEQDSVLQSLAMRKERGIMQGEALTRLGVLDHERLPQLLVRHVEVKLRAICDWDGGAWELYRGAAFAQRVHAIDIDLPRLLYSLVWKAYPFSRIPHTPANNIQQKFVGAAARPPFGITDIVSRDVGERLEKALKEGDQPMARLDTVARLKPAALEKFVWTMMLLGAIELGDRPRARGESEDLRDLQERVAALPSTNHFDLLGVHWNVNRLEIESAYERLRTREERAMKTAGEAERDLRRQFLEYVDRAYKTLLPLHSRNQYRRRAFGEAFIANQLELNRRKGEHQLYLLEDFGPAAAALAIAVELSDEDPALLAEYGLAAYLAERSAGKAGVEARKNLDRALDMMPKGEVPNLCLGMAYAASGNPSQAARHFEAVRSANPQNIYAGVLLRMSLERTAVTVEEKDEALRRFIEQRDRAVSA